MSGNAKAFRPGQRLRHRETGEEAVVYCCTCRAFILWPVVKPSPGSTTQFEPFVNPGKAFPVSFARAAKFYKEALP